MTKAANPSDRDLALAVARRRWNADVALSQLAQGSNNTIYRASHAGETIVIKLSRPHRETGALAEYRKEAWCAAQARERGVATPHVVEFGTLDGRAFAVLAFVDGKPPGKEQESPAWSALGRQARSIHDIAVEGWGGALTGDGRFGESWQAHLDYNIAALAPDDALLAHGVFDGEASRRLRLEFERIRRSEFRFGLCHGDIALWNTLLDAGGKLWLLDWGCAVAHVVPHYEINEILRGPRPDPKNLNAFLDGYGLSPSAYRAMTPDLLALAALREVDTLRWALDNKSDIAGEQTARARDAVARLG